MAAITERVYAENVFRVFVHPPNDQPHSFICEATTTSDALAAAHNYPDGTRTCAIRLCIPAADLEAAIDAGF